MLGAVYSLAILTIISMRAGQKILTSHGFAPGNNSR